MIKVVIAYDDNDSILGEYFESSFNQINNAVPNTTITPLRGLDCTEDNINAVIQPLNAEPFIFVGLSHGDDPDGEVLLTDNSVFVSQNNAHHFCNSFFYSTACNIGRALKDHLLNGGCQCFVGYNDSSWASYDDFHDVYIECENYSINEFLRTDKTISQTFTEMKEYFLQRIIEYSAAGEILLAIELQKNMDCLVMQGDSTLTRINFNVA